jgi:hypothetical protein
MFTITQGPPTDQQVMVVWGIATYLVVAPLLLLAAALCGRIARANRRDGPGAAVAGVGAAAALRPSVPREDRPVVVASAPPDVGAAV